ncbi:nitrilase-related carbon-nitrogen hydrolase [Alpinimonas psychrophila]|uniref:Putative amidohydrolase n=1 Tax=Alpinimonas psychrophila TaxID=748908 RepID=A0A7W3JVN6_9MICO|nr:nitrilase-related carbon-nitrogen hydrolase [Alpinimonas psychrophila]MBA8829604.1 putative amidohydrolase [Alpinimonas psychrophila]MBA8830078.1 putative amidohydrolase [Alpinimonas psychrophila]
MRIAVCQVSARVGERAKNGERLEAVIREAASGGIEAAGSGGANVIVIPELANTGYSFTSREELEEFAEIAELAESSTLTAWHQLARELDIVLVGGFAERGLDGDFYNSSAIVDATGVRAVYRKAHLWDAEKLIFAQGNDLPPVVDTAFGRIGLMICYDIEFPEWVREVSLRGADLLCCPVNWPRALHPASEKPSEVIKVQALASMNRIFIAIADRALADRGQEWSGASIIVDPDGFPLTTLAPGSDNIFYADVDLTLARDKDINAHNNVLADRRTDLYQHIEGLV